MNNIKKNFDNLKFISHCHPRLRKTVVKHADKKLILALCECMYNFLIGNIKTNDEFEGKAKKYKNVLRTLMNKDDTVENKKEILVQKGGFLPVLLPTILGVIANLIGK